MESLPNTDEFRQAVRTAITEKFQDLLKSARQNPGAISQLAEQIGVRRQMLSQYAAGSVPASDVLITAILKWGWVIKVENKASTAWWCDFSLTRSDRLPKRKPEPVQLSFFDALADLDQNLENLKKSVGRVEGEIERAKRA